MGPVPCPLRWHPIVPEPYQHPSTFALPCAAASPFIATAQSNVLLKAAPNFSANCSLVQSVSLSLPAEAVHMPVPRTTLGCWDTESYAAASIASS